MFRRIQSKSMCTVQPRIKEGPEHLTSLCKAVGRWRRIQLLLVGFASVRCSGGLRGKRMRRGYPETPVPTHSACTDTA
ncbi:hypothetical protein AOLI_G00226100 [Acnodon oligacanthus]